MPNGDVQETEHFFAGVSLDASVEVPQGSPPSGAGDAGAGAEDIYRVYFHGPAYQVLDRVWREGSSLIGRMATDLPAALSRGGDRLQAAPRLVELCFQTAGMWEIGTSGRMGLPHAIDRLEVFAQETASPVFAVVSRGQAGFDAEVVDESGAVLVRMAGYRTIELPGALDESFLEPLRQATKGLST